MKILPQMKRLAEQACVAYGLEAAECACAKEYELYPDGTRQYPEYVVWLRLPNHLDMAAIRCEPIAKCDCYSMSKNNVTVIAEYVDGTESVIPSWRGKLILSQTELDTHKYHIKMGYMRI